MGLSFQQWLQLAKLDCTQLGKAPPLPYTWGGKGWGGPGPRGEGLDCTGFTCGLLWRLGHLSPRRWTHSDGMLDWHRPSDTKPLDVRLYGPSANDASHAAVVLVPGRYLLESGGAGRAAHPDGADWPTRGRTWRVVKWGHRSDVIGVRRVVGQGMFDVRRDLPMLRHWVQHVRGARRGVDVPLTKLARDWGLRPVIPRREVGNAQAA